MMGKRLIQYVVIFLLPALAMGQPDFSGIKICHNENGTLKNARTEEYKIEFDQSKLSSINTLDNVVQYNAISRRLTVETNLGGNSKPMTIILTKTELLLQNTDTSITIRATNSNLIDSTATFRFGGILVPVKFKYGLLKEIFLNMGNKTVMVNIYGWEGNYYWGIFIQSGQEKRSLHYLEKGKGSPSMVVKDEIKGIGIFMYPSRKAYNEIEAIYLSGDIWTGAGTDYSLKYNKQGRLKKNETKFNLNCE